jgi:hypothetical protein
LNETDRDFDKVVFMGDYFDTFEPIGPLKQIENFRKIVEYKKKNAEKTILLFGNHDYHYLRSTEESYGGFQPVYKAAFGDLIHNAINKYFMQVCFIYEHFLFSHAGISNTWADANNIDRKNLEQSVNDLFRYKPNRFAFTPGENYDRFGDDICQTPIWIRPKSLKRDRIPGFTHVVGHTPQRRLSIGADIVLIDTIATSGEYLQIINGEMSAIRINN